MSLQSRLNDVVTAIGADYKSLNARLNTAQAKVSIDGGATPNEPYDSPPPQNNQYSGALEIASAVGNTNYVLTGTAAQLITSFAGVVVPAGSACDLDVKGGLLLAVTTGTHANTVAHTIYIRIKNNLNAYVGFGQFQFYGTGVTQDLMFQMPVGATLDAQPADRTYQLEAAYNRQGSLGASMTVVLSSPFPQRVFQAIRR